MDRHYFLQTYAGEGQPTQRYDLHYFPLVVGREAGSGLHLPRSRISRQHARLDLDGNRLILTDLGSTNGSFINHERISEPTEVMAGDVLHFADHEFRVMAEERASSFHATHDSDATRVGMASLPKQLPAQARQFFQMIEHERVEPCAQSIRTADGDIFALELLGRGRQEGLPSLPGELFHLAESLGEEVRLSRLFRESGIRAAAKIKPARPLFINTHPSESRDYDALLGHISDLLNRFETDKLSLVLEIHEGAVTDLAAMEEVRRSLKDMGVRLAYDDFGAGQARLQELIDVPPDFLKFDIALIGELKNRDSSRFRLLSSLNNAIADMGVQTVAEGIEVEATMGLCREIGIDYFQGFLFDRPKALETN